MNKTRSFLIGAVVAAPLLISFGRLWAPAVAQGGRPGVPATQPSGDKTHPLGKLEKKIEVLAGGEKATIQAVCYKGRGPRKGFVIRSDDALRRLAGSYGHTPPQVDFEADVVLFVRASDARCVDIDVDAVAFEKGELTGVVMREIMKGGEPQQEESFVMVVLPKSVLTGGRDGHVTTGGLAAQTQKATEPPASRTRGRKLKQDDFYGEIDFKDGRKVDYVWLRTSGYGMEPIPYSRTLAFHDYAGGLDKFDLTQVSRIDFIDEYCGWDLPGGKSVPDYAKVNKWVYKAKVTFRDGAVWEDVYIYGSAWMWRSTKAKGYLVEARSITINTR